MPIPNPKRWMDFTPIFSVIMKCFSVFVLALAAFITSSCQREATPLPQPGVLLTTRFAQGTDGWEADYTDYHTPQDSIIHFKSELASLPAPLDASQKALSIYGANRSDDLFMFIRRKLTGLLPSTTYSLRFAVELATPYPASSFGIGGSPATSIYLKAGASANQPIKIKNGDYYEFSLDKGQQSQSGKDLFVIGNLANGNDVAEYTLVERTSEGQPFHVTTNSKGELWVVVGTDSGFEGNQLLYYSRITVTAL